jgi:plasmid segregation protein ParM
VAGSARIDRLVTGLPVAQYQGTARRERLRAMLTGTHQVTPQRQVEVAAVDILPQPAGAYLDMTRDATAAEAFEEARTLVIDPGFFSVDWVLIDGGELRSANSGSTTNAMSLLIEAADDLIQQEHGARLGRDQIEKAIRLGSARVKLFGEPIELAPYIAAAAKRTTAVALAAVRQSMRGERREVDVILLAGGGAAVYADATRDAFPKARVVVPEAPVLANVRGFWTHAAPTDAVTENAATDVDDGVAAPPKVASKRPVATPARRGAPLRGVTGRGAKPRGDC